MKKTLSIISYTLISVLLLNTLLTFIFIKDISIKLDKESLGLILIYIVETMAIIWLIISLIFLIIGTVKSSFIGSIMIIIFGIMSLFSIFLVTWIFGTINIVCGLGLIITASIHLKNHRDSL